MLYRKFGNTGINISALGFGAMRLPKTTAGGNEVFDHEEGARIIRRAVELGVNYVDTAPYYCDKESEVIVGKALKGIRDKVYLSTKNPIEDANGDSMRRNLEGSLKRLDVDHIDFYHMWGLGTERFETKVNVPGGHLEALRRAMDEGLVKHASFSFHDVAESLIKIVDAGVFETVLCQYNLLDRSNEAAMQYAFDKGLGVVVMGPLGGGRLGGPSEAIRALLPGKVSSSPEIALRFVLSHPGVACALSGMGSIEMVEENARIASDASELTGTEKQRITEAVEENKRLAQLYCTGCDYCMPCPQNINIPGIFDMMNYNRVYGQKAYAKQQYASIGKTPWNQGQKDASACVECAACEGKCPQHIKIIEQLKDVARELG